MLINWVFDNNKKANINSMVPCINFLAFFSNTLLIFHNKHLVTLLH